MLRTVWFCTSSAWLVHRDWWGWIDLMGIGRYAYLNPWWKKNVVAGVTFADVLAQCKTPEIIDLVKCDIEGAETEVFADGSAWICRVRFLIVELQLHPPIQA